MDETDPETALAENPAGGGNMAEVAAWVGAATLFGLGVGAVVGPKQAEEYFAGYLLEQSLSVDNLFVFVLVFDYFKVPLPQQQKVLGYGIGGAMAAAGAKARFPVVRASIFNSPRMRRGASSREDAINE